MATYLDNPDGLIGDFLGTIPIMIELAKQDKLYVKIHPEIAPMYDIIPKRYKMERVENKLEVNEPINRELTLDISAAFSYAHENNLYMSQAHFGVLGLPVPEVAPKAELHLWRIAPNVPQFDYLISPFARSLPPEQKWAKEKWQELVDSYPEYKFAVLGNTAYDPINYITGANVMDLYSKPFLFVGHVFQKAKYGLISVITGTSHFAFHLGVKNYLLDNQNMTWGRNPEATRITVDIQELTVDEVRQVIDNGRNL